MEGVFGEFPQRHGLKVNDRDGHGLPRQELRRFQPPLAGDQAILRVDHDRMSDSACRNIPAAPWNGTPAAFTVTLDEPTFIGHMFRVQCGHGQVDRIAICPRIGEGGMCFLQAALDVRQ